MIVLDASVVVELLTNGGLAHAIQAELSECGGPFLVPHLLDVEVVSAIRGLTAGKGLDAHLSHQLLTALADLPAERIAHTPLMPRVWELRHNFTAYDAVYIALAEDAGAVLFTCDDKLRVGHRAKVRLFRQ